jgi:hypothetical protein
MLPAELFHPGSVAVVGASRNPEKVGYGVFANLVSAPLLTSRGPLYTVCKVWGKLPPFLPGKSHIIPLMEEEMALFKSLVPPWDGAR